MAASADRISELPEPLLQNILCFLSQKQAVQTCVLSKSWRYLGSTRPKLEFLYLDYGYQKLIPILDKSLHVYHDQKLCIQEFHVEFRSTNDPESIQFLEKWFPFIVATMSGAKAFVLTFGWACPRYIDLPSEFFENSKSLRKLRLGGFRFSQNLPMVQHFKHLQALTLEHVHIVDDETFQNILSSCLYVEHVVLSRCEGLTTIRVINSNYLKRFDLFDFHEEDLCFVDVPNLESVKIEMGGNWLSFDRQRNMYFPGLKSLELRRLRLTPTRPSLEILSRDFPCLQHFNIHQCGGFGELRVSNRSIKHLAISYLGKSIKVAVDAPNIEVLDYKSSLPLEISFATTFNVWKSNIKPWFGLHSEDFFLKLSKLINSVSRSMIYLQLPLDYESSDEEEDENDNDYHDICGGGYDDKPVAVEYLHLESGGHGFFNSEDNLNRIFHYCRPRNILERECTQRSELLCEILILLRQKEESPYFCYWQQDLEKASMQMWDKNSEEWHSVEGTAFLESGAADRSPTYDLSKHHEVWFKLKWRE